MFMLEKKGKLFFAYRSIWTYLYHQENVTLFTRDIKARFSVWTLEWVLSIYFHYIEKIFLHFLLFVFFIYIISIYSRIWKIKFHVTPILCSTFLLSADIYMDFFFLFISFFLVFFAISNLYSSNFFSEKFSSLISDTRPSVFPSSRTSKYAVLKLA